MNPKRDTFLARVCLLKTARLAELTSGTSFALIKVSGGWLSPDNLPTGEYAELPIRQKLEKEELYCLQELLQLDALQSFVNKATDELYQSLHSRVEALEKNLQEEDILQELLTPAKEQKFNN